MSAEHDVWSIVHGPRCMVHDAWCTVHCAWCMVHCALSIVHGLWCMVHGVHLSIRPGDLEPVPVPCHQGPHQGHLLVEAEDVGM